MSRLVAFLGEHLVPALLMALFFVVQVAGVLRWLPVAPEVERDWAHYALLLGVVSAVFASGWYLDERDYGLPQFLVTIAVAVAMAVPSMVGPSVRDVGVSPDAFSVITRVSYVGFHVTNGFLIGGAWTFVVRRFPAAGQEEA